MVSEWFFGDEGVWKESCLKYGRKLLPDWLMREAAALGDPKSIGYGIGYAFAETMAQRQLIISQEDLLRIAREYFPAGGPEPFLDGFARFGEKRTERQAL